MTISYGTDYGDTDAWADEDGTVHYLPNADPHVGVPSVAEMVGTNGLSALQSGLQPPGGWRPDERAEIERAQLAAVDIGELYPELDWHKVWRETPDEVDWLVEPIIERGRLYALYSPPKVGKSLVTQEIAAGLAAGRPVLGNAAREPMHVLYVDLENSPADLVERLSAYGYGPDDLGNLHYLSFPNLPALDSPVGGQQLLAAAIHYRAVVVVIDTVSRVIAGKENDADTFNALYRYALAPLKGRGITIIRLDHAGKDGDRGQRGSSGKGTDVDVVWRYTKAGQVMFTLQREFSRNNHSPEEIHLIRRFSPLRHEITGEVGVDPAVLAVVDKLNELRIPLDHGRDKAKACLVAAEFPCRNDVLAAAIKHRKAHQNSGE